jgi:hypothetical protein
MPDNEDLFPYGPNDGNCYSCGCYVSADQQSRHLTWHQDIYTATNVG